MRRRKPRDRGREIAARAVHAVQLVMLAAGIRLGLAPAAVVVAALLMVDSAYRLMCSRAQRRSLATNPFGR